MRAGKLFRVGPNCIAWPVDKYDLRNTKQIILQNISPIVLRYKTLIMVIAVAPFDNMEVSWVGNDPGWFSQAWLILTEHKKTFFIKSRGSTFTDVTPFTNEKGDVIKYFDEEMNLVEVVS